MEALRGATYEELVDSGVRPVHAKLILSSLGTRSAAATHAVAAKTMETRVSSARSELERSPCSYRREPHFGPAGSRGGQP